jgi:hypothetical protein
MLFNVHVDISLIFEIYFMYGTDKILAQLLIICKIMIAITCQIIFDYKMFCRKPYFIISSTPSQANS